MQPLPDDGAIAPGPISHCSVKFDAGISLNPFPLEVLYCGDAPGFVAGAIQLNVRIPEVFTNGQTTFSVQIGDISLPNSVSLAVSLK
jgi:uncharacterized protein (TIGR03437 family)